VEAELKQKAAPSVGKLDKQALKKKTAPGGGGSFDPGGFRRRPPKRGHNDTDAEIKQINRTQHAEDGESGGGGGQQRAKTEGDADKKQEIAKLNARYASQARPKPVTRGLRHRTHHGRAGCQRDERPGCKIE
jgi:hypothetical protein